MPSPHIPARARDGLSRFRWDRGGFLRDNTYSGSSLWFDFTAFVDMLANTIPLVCPAENGADRRGVPVVPAYGVRKIGRFLFVDGVVHRFSLASILMIVPQLHWISMDSGRFMGLLKSDHISNTAANGPFGDNFVIELMVL
jgi:hypothetical protein